MRPWNVDNRIPVLLLVLMLIIVIGAVLAVRRAKNVMWQRSPVPAIISRLPWLAPEYLDRAAIEEQGVSPPRLVRALLWPVLGSPALLDPSARLDVVLDRPYLGAQLALVPRGALAELDQHLYALPPMPNGDAIIAQRIAAAQMRGKKSSLEMVLLPEERKAIVGVLADANYQKARNALLVA